MKKGVSALIAMVLSILFGVVMITLVITVLNPTLNRAKDSGALTEAYQNLPLLDSAISEVASEAAGSKRTINLIVSNGEYEVDAANDYITFTYNPNEDMHLSGRRGDIFIERGHVFTDFFNNYVENSDGSPTWKIITGKWNVTNYKYRGEGGLAYHNVGNHDHFKFSGTITNISGPTGGQIFAVPGSPANLVGFWPFDNGTGSKAYDWSGNTNNGTLTNMNTTGNATSGWTTDCKYGSCLMFDGVNDWVNITPSPTLNLNQYTISIWVYIRATDIKHILELKNATERKIRFFVASSTKVEWDVLPGEIGNRQATYSLNTWAHYVLTFNGTTATMYTNGVLESSTNADMSLTQIGNISIGSTTTPTLFINATIDEVKIWNRSLTADEVAAEYELSTKKLAATGTIEAVSQSTNLTIVLANPDGKTKFDDIKVNEDDKKLKLIIPYTNVDLNGTGSFPAGQHRVAIEHMGVNSTTNKPVIQIS